MKRRSSMMTGVVVAVVGLMITGCSEGISKPKMPVTVTYSESAGGEGYVVQFQNQTAKYLQVRVRLKNRTLNKERDGYIDLSPNGSTEIGWREGWKFVSGETIHLSHEDYASANFRIP